MAEKSIKQELIERILKLMTEKNTKQELIDEYKRLCAEMKSKGKKLPTGTSGMNMKSTKADILSAINTIENALKSGSTASAPAITNTVTETVITTTPKKEAKTKTTSSTQKEDTDLNYLSEKIIEKIQALETAKSLKKSEYDTILEVEKELLRFVGMINNMKTESMNQVEAQQAQQENQKERIEALKKDAEERNAEKINDANADLEALEKSIEDAKKKLDSDREVEEEAYQYKIGEEQKKSDDEWSDVVADYEEVFANIELEISKLTAELTEKDAVKKEYEAKLAELPELLKKAEEEGAALKEKELGKEYGYKSSKSKKESENTIQALQEEIELLRKDYEDALAEKQAIQSKLDKAYEENNKLYIQTVQSTGGIKILNNSDKS